MFTKIAFALVLTVNLAGTPAAASPDDAATYTGGLWPSEKLTELLLRRWAQHMCMQFELTKDEQKKVEDAMVRRWEPYLKQNRSKIAPLLNEFIEMRLEMEPPQKERVQEWATRAMPVFDEFNKVLKTSLSEVQEALPPVQRAQFELEQISYSAGMAVAEASIKQWQSGEFEQKSFWEPTGIEIKRRNEEFQRAREEQTRAALEKAGKPVPPPAPADPDEISKELHAWERYVEQFVKVYMLDNAQRDAALSCLNELRTRAINHRDSRREAIAKLEAKIQEGAGTKEDLDEIKKQLSDLYGPIDEMFKELKNRIEKIPTAEQRARVEEPAAKEEAKPESPRKDNANGD